MRLLLLCFVSLLWTSEKDTLESIDVRSVLIVVRVDGAVVELIEKSDATRRRMTMMMVNMLRGGRGGCRGGRGRRVGPTAVRRRVVLPVRCIHRCR